VKRLSNTRCSTTETRIVHVNDPLFDRDNPNCVYIGRAVPRRGFCKSRWSNRFRIGIGADRDTVLDWYRCEMLTRCTRRRSDGKLTAEARRLRKAIVALRGKTLGCWCTEIGKLLTIDDPLICHGQILAQLAEEYANSSG